MDKEDRFYYQLVGAVSAIGALGWLVVVFSFSDTQQVFFQSEFLVIFWLLCCLSFGLAVIVLFFCFFLSPKDKLTRWINLVYLAMLMIIYFNCFPIGSS